jgi:cobalt-zinc-cadmium efflux system protein
VGVIIGGVIIRLTGWYLVDSLIGVLIGGIVLRGAVDLVFESGEILLEATPRDIDMTELKREMEKVPGVRGVHDIHVWTIGSGRRALSAHVMTDDITTREGQVIACRVRAARAETFSITHTTLEMECDSCLSQSCEYVPKKGGLSV